MVSVVEVVVVWVLEELDAPPWVDADGCGAACINCEKSGLCCAG